MGVVCTSSNKQKQIKVNEVIKAEPKPTEKPSSKENNEIDNKKNNNISNLCLLQMGAHTKLHQLQSRMCKVQRLSENGVGETRNAEQQSLE